MQNQYIALMVVGIAALSAVTVITSFEEITPVTSTTEGAKILGHVQLTVFDENGDVKSYTQSDNLVVNTGLQSISDLIFATTQATGEGTFNTIIVGTGANTADATDTLASLTQRSNRIQDTSVANFGTAGGEIVATWDGTNTGGFGNDLNNGTGTVTILEVGLTTGARGTPTNSTANHPLFAFKTASVAIGQSDSLQVTWQVSLADSDSA